MKRLMYIFAIVAATASAEDLPARGNEAAPDALVSMDFSATRSERVEVSCNGLGAAGFEPHEPT